MTNWNVRGEPLQLLATFRALYEQRHVGRAADVRGLTQSAASKHLAKLRDWFDDELFTRTADGMQPTPRARALVAKVDAVLATMDALSAEAGFEPSRCTETFVLATTDEVRYRLLPALVRRLEQHAPRVRLSWLPLTPDYALPQLETGAVSAVISVSWHAPEQLLQRRLFADHFVCVMHCEHPLAGRSELSVDDYVAWPHVLVAPLGMRRGVVDDALAARGLRRFVRLSVPEFHQVRPELLGTRHLVTLPRKVVEDLRGRDRLVCRPVPVALGPVVYHLLWHRRFAFDPARAWLRDQVVQLAGGSFPDGAEVG